MEGRKRERENEKGRDRESLENGQIADCGV